MGEQTVDARSHRYRIGMKTVEVNFHQPVAVEQQTARQLKDIL